ncbi:DUF3276 family protein [Porphyromonas gingivalis]|uniref:DUF3276 family protein n=1 Tax=Porphyromonas gingivalis TaxID=837 RepID=UPI001F15B5CC|nr:DUF3276 family protein [Porphyromonas gingivalis]MCE8165356.1 DUF3276 family protein [Porphyromonas gingivalis]
MTDKLPFALYSRCVKAGKRFYYIDAKRDSKGNDYLVITESNSAEEGSAMTRHKVFLYREDFAKFTEAFLDVLKSFEKRSGVSGCEQVIGLSELEQSLSDMTTGVEGLAESSDSILEEDEPLKIDFDF